MDIVDIIDVMDGKLFPGIKPKERIPRLRRPPPSPTVTSQTESDEEDVVEEETIGSSGSRLKVRFVSYQLTNI